jgi:hypothetical protein
MQPLPSFWRSDKGLTALLLCLVATIFVAPPLMTAGIIGPIVFDIFFGLILVSGVAALARRRGATILAALVAVLVMTTRVATSFNPSETLASVNAWLSMLSLLLLTVLTLAQVFRAGPITTGRIAGAIAAYLLLGFTWAFAYELVLFRFPDAIRFVEVMDHRMDQRIALVYFSFVTLTTVGYGDITPVATLARSIAECEALVGQLFPAILIARLVSMEISERELRRIESKDDPKK